MNVHKGDTVQVITGKDRGLKGKVLLAYPKDERILVEGANRVKKHTKVTTTGRGAQTGGIVTQEAPVHVSNVMVVCPNCDKPSRIGHRRDENCQQMGEARGCWGEIAGLRMPTWG